MPRRKERVYDLDEARRQGKPANPPETRDPIETPERPLRRPDVRPKTDRAQEIPDQTQHEIPLTGVSTSLSGEDRDLIPGTTEIIRSIAHAVSVKDEDIFFLCDADGSVPFERGHGLGLYYHDCRYLNGYLLRIAGYKPEVLVRNAERGFTAVIGLTNPPLKMPDSATVPRHSIEIKWTRIIQATKSAVYDELVYNNLRADPVEFEVSLAFRAGFEDVFAVRGADQQYRGKLNLPAWIDGDLLFSYEGADGLYRSMRIGFTPPPSSTEETSASFRVSLGPKSSYRLLVSLTIAESPDRAEMPRKAPVLIDLNRIKTSLRRSCDEWIQRETQVQTDSLMLNRLMAQSLHDLSVLRTQIDGMEYFDAGLPWFAALFGRDSIITAIQTLAYDSRIGDQTLRLLARYQGKCIDEWREEQPGKILHELRVGEMARVGEIPHTPYYGSIDSTPLFLVLAGLYARWTGDLTVLNEERANIDAALDWVDTYGDIDGDGYLEYEKISEKGLVNQGWKDSADAIVNADGSIARPPIALVEVQGYVYMAKMLLADLFQRVGELDRAARLEREATELRERFNQDFWLDEGFYALALQEGNAPARVMSSNAGLALWSGIADDHKARETGERLMAEDMFNGWGVRTLSEKELRYNPLGYHLGTVWPHDNSMIAQGLRRYGFDKAALRILMGMIESAVHFDAQRLPELFAGFRRSDYGVPVNYPVACQPQAWAAGAIPYVISSLLGIRPNGIEKKLEIVRPVMPDFVSRVEIECLRVGPARVDIRFRRSNGDMKVDDVKVDGNLDVEIIE